MKKDIYIMGIESSCDETSIAIVKNGREVLSNVINSQIKIHTEYIKLDDLLKFSGLVVTGGQAKAVILEGMVKVDGEVCLMRGKKLRGGEIVEFEGNQVKVVTE